MLIKQIEIYKSPVKLKEPFIISLGPAYYAENIIVIIRTDTGINGYGECSPFSMINGETIDTGFIVGHYLAENLLGKDPLNIPECHSIMDRTIYGNSSIKSAFDIALYDIASQNANVPLHSFLGGNNRKKLFTDYTVSLSDPACMAENALKVKKRGFRIIKIKLGETGRKDIERVRMIREKVGPEITLRIDANQGWNKSEAIETLITLEPYNIEFCEEPIPRWDFMDLPEISKKSPVPVMADESCCDSHDARRLIDIGACTLFNVKLGKSAGIYDALKIIHLAAQTGMKVQMGGFLETRLGFTASAHLALAGENVRFCDFDTPLMLTEDPVNGGINYKSGGMIIVPNVPGLGATIKQEFLESLTNTVIC